MAVGRIISNFLLSLAQDVLLLKDDPLVCQNIKVKVFGYG